MSTVIEKRVARVLDELNYDFTDFSIEAFAQFIGKRLGREILFIPLRMPPARFGAWIRDKDEPLEFIFYQQGLTSVHTIHILLHELGHLILGHPTAELGAADIKQILLGACQLPALSAQRFRKGLQQEEEAELMATLICEKVVKSRKITPDSSIEEGAEYLRAVLEAHG